MTRKELMLNRILDKNTVAQIRAWWQAERYSLDMADENEDDYQRQMYISDEKIQRMPPEEISDILLDDEFSGIGERPTTDDFIRILSAATGRTEQELRDAIFGTGSFNAVDFYRPTERQKKAIKFYFKTGQRLAERNLGMGDFDKWPEEYQKEWMQILDEFPEEARNEDFSEIKKYIKFYTDNGMPHWLY